MSTSGGSGYCDCGDQEAWRSGAFCDIHECGMLQQQNETQVSRNLSDYKCAAFQHVIYSVRLHLYVLCFSRQDLFALDH